MTEHRVLLLDDHRAFLEALAESLQVQPGIEVIGATTRADEALALAARHRPDVALVDLVMPDADGIETGMALRAAQPDLALVAVTAVDEASKVASALRAGFAGWVSKDTGIAQLVAVITAVARGETTVPGLLLTKALREIIGDQESAQERQEALAVLTVRERDVLRCMTSGAGRREIADALYISENTVRTHVQNILTKLGVHSSLSAIVLARQAGLTWERGSEGGPGRPGSDVEVGRQRRPRPDGLRRVGDGGLARRGGPG